MLKQMKDLYLILGYNNVSDFQDGYFDDIDLESVVHKEFETEKERQIFIDALYLLDGNLHNLGGNYLIIEKKEFDLLTQ